MIRRITILIVATSVIFLCGQTLAADAISVSKIDGLDPITGGLLANTPIRYYIHFQVGADTLIAFTSGFRVYSPDSAVWQPLVLRELVMASNFFDLDFRFYYGSVDGINEDTVGAIGIRLFGHGLPPSFDSDFFLIETSVSEEQIGKSLCLDSSFFDLNAWLWITTASGRIPSWDGPHCYEIVDCCSGNRGDVNGDGTNHNILDLTRLVDYLFRGSAPPDCKLESDVNGDGTPYNIIDLTFVVDYIHRGGPAAGPCPN